MPALDATFVTSRELLSDALTLGAAGEGDVHVRADPARGRMSFECRDGGGILTCVVPREPVMVLLDKAGRAIADRSTREADLIEAEIDAVLTDLLD